MGMALGLPLRDLFALVLGKGDLRSLLCLIAFSIVVLILAYLTNPTENSFRAYLTEQSFRQHLSKLDDNADDNNLHIDRVRSLTSPKNNPASPVSSSASAPENLSSFHFANRASISLRTPKHIFHSFGIFTVAAMLPTTKASERESCDNCMVSDSWYVGAFGRWWRGGIFEEWYQDVIAGPKDEESWTSGIFNMKRLDMFRDYEAPTFSANNLPAHLAPGSPPRLRNRERSAQRNDATRLRSSTPPPLPKSASLPMHTVRSGNRVYDSTRLRQHSPLNSENATRASAPPSRSSSTSFEQSPAIAEVLRQITSAKTSVAELRAQLAECQTSAAQSKSALQQEVDGHRERKRQEDASKAELKARTKNFEDSKRTAEGSKKEADKKLRAAQSTRDDATRRMEFLDNGITKLQDQIAQDRGVISSRKEQVSEEERTVPASVERKRQEIKVAEEQVHTLNQRSRELEDKLSARREKLRILREKIEQYNARRSSTNFDLPQQQYYSSQDPWLAGTENGGQSLRLSPVQHHQPVWNAQSGTLSTSQLLSSTLSNAAPEEHFSKVFSDSSSFNGYLNDMHGKSRALPQNFVSAGHGGVFDEQNNMSRSFNSDNDPYRDRTWPGAYLTSNLDGPPLTSLNACTSDAFTRSDYNNCLLSTPAKQTSSTDRPRICGSVLSSKGLNPDAKEFNFSPSSNTVAGGIGAIHNPIVHKPTPPVYDALNPSGFPSTTTTAQRSLLRAFALSPEEREALQRTLGGLSNRSFERLPNLSDVGSIPSSPTVVTTNGGFNNRLPAWLQSLPRKRKMNFSPWDDEDPQAANNSKKG